MNNCKDNLMLKINEQHHRIWAEIAADFIRNRKILIVMIMIMIMMTIMMVMN